MPESQGLLRETNPAAGADPQTPASPPLCCLSEEKPRGEERLTRFPLLFFAAFYFFFLTLACLPFFFSPPLSFGLLVFNSLLSLPQGFSNLQVYAKYSVKSTGHGLCLASELGLFWKLSGSKLVRYRAPRKKSRALVLRSLALHHRSDHWAQAGPSPLHLSGRKMSCLKNVRKTIRGVEELLYKKKLCQL